MKKVSINIDGNSITGVAAGELRFINLTGRNLVTIYGLVEDSGYVAEPGEENSKGEVPEHLKDVRFIVNDEVVASDTDLISFEEFTGILDEINLKFIDIMHGRFLNLTGEGIRVKYGTSSYRIPKSGITTELLPTPLKQETSLIKCVRNDAIGGIPTPVKDCYFIVRPECAAYLAEHGEFDEENFITPDVANAERNFEGQILSYPGFLRIVE